MPLVIPEQAYYSRLAGKVRARVFIGVDGVVEGVRLLDVAPRRGMFEDAALDALRQIRYRPALKDGHAVRSQKVVEVSFDPYEDKPQGAL